MNFLIIATNPNGYSTKRLVEEATKAGHTSDVFKPSDFYLHCSDAVRGYDRAYLKEKRMIAKDVNTIIPRVGGNLNYGSYVVRHFTDNLSVPTTATADGLLLAADKWVCAQVMSKNKVQVPKTTICDSPEDFGFLVNSVGGLPCVAKVTAGSQGKGIFILETELAGSTALQAFSNAKQRVLLQQFIETAKDDDRKSDIRAWVVDGKVVSAYRRFSMHEDFRSNYSISKLGEPVVLTPNEKMMAIKAAQVAGLGCAGVDIMRDIGDSNKPYLIEINGNASLQGIEKVTGDNVAKSVIEYAARIGSKGPASVTNPSPPAQIEPIDEEMSRYKGGGVMMCATTKRANK